jgi:hypothetical protein
VFLNAGAWWGGARPPHSAAPTTPPRIAREHFVRSMWRNLYNKINT